MEPREIVVARLGRGPTLARYVGEDASRVVVAIGRNRQARIPAERILLSTGIVADSQEDMEKFRTECQELSSAIDLAEVWEVMGDESGAASLDDLANLYWGPSPKATQRVAMALHLETNHDHFFSSGEGYETRPRQSVEEIQARRRREAENAEASLALMTSLAEGLLPPKVSARQTALLEHLRGYAVHGDEYARSHLARSVLDTLDWGTRDLQRRCFDLLASAGVFSPDEPLELHRAGINEAIPEEAIAEGSAIVLVDPLKEPHRLDLTALHAITIDDAEAEERDDALSIEMDDVLDGEDVGFRIGIHIADAGALIPHGGAIDREADRRMATLYLPEGRIDMLPPGFSRRVGSLDPGKTRIALSLLVRVTSSFEVSAWEVRPSIVRSEDALSYESADIALEDENSPWHRTLTDLRSVAEAWRRKRERANAITFERAEMAIRVAASGEVEVKVVEPSSPSRELVAGLMILCNTLLAELCRNEGVPAGFRTQAPPDLADLAISTPAGVEVPKGPLGRYLVMRRMTPAELHTTPAPHSGLGVQAYIQATSPLRRYPDLVMQRQISHFLSSGQPFYSSDALTSVMQRAEVQLREVARLEEARKRYWFLKYLRETRLEGAGSADGSSLFPATVLENEPRRLALLELDEFPFRVRAEVARSCSPGDTVTLKLHGVDLWERIGHFVQVPDTT
jgi:exoribonuclease-2